MSPFRDKAPPAGGSGPPASPGQVNATGESSGPSEFPRGADSGESSTESRAFDVSDLFRRLVEAGSKPGGVKQKAPEFLRQVANELKVPKEVIAHTISQLDETKQGVYRAIGREVHDLLERTSLADELAKALSLLSLEIKMEVRFKPSNTKRSSHPSAEQSEPSTRRDAGKTDANKTEEVG